MTADRTLVMPRPFRRARIQGSRSRAGTPRTAPGFAARSRRVRERARVPVSVPGSRRRHSGSRLPTRSRQASTVGWLKSWRGHPKGSHPGRGKGASPTQDAAGYVPAPGCSGRALCAYPKTGHGRLFSGRGPIERPMCGTARRPDRSTSMTGAACTGWSAGTPQATHVPAATRRPPCDARVPFTYTLVIPRFASDRAAASRPRSCCVNPVPRSEVMTVRRTRSGRSSRTSSASTTSRPGPRRPSCRSSHASQSQPRSSRGAE